VPRRASPSSPHFHLASSQPSLLPPSALPVLLLGLFPGRLLGFPADVHFVADVRSATRRLSYNWPKWHRHWPSSPSRAPSPVSSFASSACRRLPAPSSCPPPARLSGHLRGTPLAAFAASVMTSYLATWATREQQSCVFYDREMHSRSTKCRGARAAGRSGTSLEAWSNLPDLDRLDDMQWEKL